MVMSEGERGHSSSARHAWVHTETVKATGTWACAHRALLAVPCRLKGQRQHHQGGEHHTAVHTRATASFPGQVFSSRDALLADTSLLSHRHLGWYLPWEQRGAGEFMLVPGHEIFISTGKEGEKIKRQTEQGEQTQCLQAAQHGTDMPTARLDQGLQG